MNDVDYNYVAYLFRHFDPEAREESQGSSGNADKKTAETEIGSDDCSVSARRCENTELAQVTRNGLNESEESSNNTFLAVVENTESERNGGAFAKLGNFDGDGKMEEMNTGLNCGMEEMKMELNCDRTEQNTQSYAPLVVQNKEINRSENIQNGCIVGRCCHDRDNQVTVPEAGENDQMDVSPVVGKGGVVELLSLSALLVNRRRTSIDQQAQKIAMMRCKLPGMLYIIKEPVLRRIVFICLYLW